RLASLSSLYLESQFLSLGNPPYRFSLFTGCSKGLSYAWGNSIFLAMRQAGKPQLGI
ncbi:MAG: hypothetical protein CFH40_01978, partial [Alphaproteobacteria bacterium MarineAlpha10_Bin3]